MIKNRISNFINSKVWWENLSNIEKNEYFDMYYKDMKRRDLLRTVNIDELDDLDIEEIYNDYC